MIDLFQFIITGFLVKANASEEHGTRLTAEEMLAQMRLVVFPQPCKVTFIELRTAQFY